MTDTMRPTLAPLTSLSDVLSIQSDIDAVDFTAREMEAKWGAGRLPLIVGPDFREAFYDQRSMLNGAIWAGDVGETRRHAEAMIRGWRALDAAATADGQSPLSVECWETTTDDGEVLAIVRTNAEAAALTRQGRKMQVWTLAEIGRALGRYADTAGLVKTIFEGATVECVRLKVRPPVAEHVLDDIEAALNEEVPF